MIIEIVVKNLEFNCIGSDAVKPSVSFDKFYLRKLYTDIRAVLGLSEMSKEELYSFDTVQLRCRIIDCILNACNYSFSRLTVHSICYDTFDNRVLITPAPVLSNLR